MRLFRRAAARRTGPPADSGLFVIGAARSGTTILQNALNDSADIYLLGEPDLHRDPGTPGFAARYEAMHAAWHNQPTKSSALPLVAGRDGPWDAHLDALSRHHRYVGAKIVVNPRRPADWMDDLLRFQCARFYPARHLFVFRRPDNVVRSIRAFQRLKGEPVTSAAEILWTLATTLLLYTRMARTMPHVRMIAHEDAGERTFRDLGDWLGVSLAGAAAYSDRARERSHEDEALDAEEAHALSLMTALHEDLRALAGGAIDRPQLEQNRLNPSADHLTAIGSIDNRATIIETFLARHCRTTSTETLGR